MSTKGLWFIWLWCAACNSQEGSFQTCVLPPDPICSNRGEAANNAVVPQYAAAMNAYSQVLTAINASMTALDSVGKNISSSSFNLITAHSANATADDSLSAPPGFNFTAADLATEQFQIRMNLANSTANEAKQICQEEFDCRDAVVRNAKVKTECFEHEIGQLNVDVNNAQILLNGAVDEVNHQQLVLSGARDAVTAAEQKVFQARTQCLGKRRRKRGFWGWLWGGIKAAARAVAAAAVVVYHVVTFPVQVVVCQVADVFFDQIGKAKDVRTNAENQLRQSQVLYENALSNRQTLQAKLNDLLSRQHLAMTAYFGAIQQRNVVQKRHADASELFEKIKMAVTSINDLTGDSEKLEKVQLELDRAVQLKLRKQVALAQLFGIGPIQRNVFLPLDDISRLISSITGNPTLKWLNEKINTQTSLIRKKIGVDQVDNNFRFNSTVAPTAANVTKSTFNPNSTRTYDIYQEMGGINDQ